MQVWHMSGAGNDFMILDARGQKPDFPVLSRSLCSLTHADGFMAADASEKADFRLHFYNSDGSRGEMCGNGSRCICRFAFDTGLAGSHMTVETDAGIIEGWRQSENQYRVRLNLPSIVDSHRVPGVTYVELGNPGIPHAVKELPDLQWSGREDLHEEAVRLRHHPAFPKGANVSFFTCLSEDEVRVLTYERYVEDYTLACGTGCASIAVALRSAGLLPGGHLTAHNPGGDLRLSVEESGGRFQSVSLEGPADVLKIYNL